MDDPRTELFNNYRLLVEIAKNFLDLDTNQHLVLPNGQRLTRVTVRSLFERDFGASHLLSGYQIKLLRDNINAILRGDVHMSYEEYYQVIFETACA